MHLHMGHNKQLLKAATHILSPMYDKKYQREVSLQTKCVLQLNQSKAWNPKTYYLVTKTHKKHIAYSCQILADHD